jgi:putative transposase
VCWWAKVGWVCFRRSRAFAGWRSYRITGERAGRWHIAFALVPEPIPAPGTGGVVGVDRDVTVAVAETVGRTVVRHRLAGPRTGEVDQLAQDLPGYPDNIARGSDGLIWVTIA